MVSFNRLAKHGGTNSAGSRNPRRSYYPIAGCRGTLPANPGVRFVGGNMGFALPHGVDHYVILLGAPLAGQQENRKAKIIPPSSARLQGS